MRAAIDVAFVVLAAGLALAGCGNTYVLGNLPSEDAGDGSTAYPSFPNLGCEAGQDGGCATPTPFDPCAGISCGEACKPCQPNDPRCGPQIATNFFCDRNGACTETPTTCGDAGAGYVPCAGSTCGQACTLCAPNDPTCAEADIAKVCGGDAVCSKCVAL